MIDWEMNKQDLCTQKLTTIYGLIINKFNDEKNNRFNDSIKSDDNNRCSTNLG